MIKVFISAAPIMRTGLESFLADDERFSVVGHAFPGVDLTLRLEETQPDLLVMEVEHPWDDLLAFLHELHGEGGARAANARSPAVILLGDDAETDFLLESLRAGVAAILPRLAGAAEIVAAMEAVANGLVTLRQPALDALLQHISPPARENFTEGQHIEALTAREVEILGMLAEGLGNKTIAFRLGISDHTVKFHVSSIFSKLGVSSRTEAVTLGLRRGLIML